MAVIATVVGLSGTPTPNPNDGDATNSVPGEKIEETMKREPPVKEPQGTTQSPVPTPKSSGSFITPRFPLLLCPLCSFVNPIEDPFSC